MTLARVAGSLAGPWDLVRRELDAALGDPTCGGERGGEHADERGGEHADERGGDPESERADERESEWRWSRASWPFTLRASADPAAGRVEVTVDTDLPYAASAALAGVLAVAVFLSPTPAVPLASAALAGCLLLTLGPLVPGLVHFRRFHRRTGPVVDVDSYRITPAVLPPLAGFLLGLWTAGTGVFRAPAMLLSAFLFTFFAYATAPEPVTLRRQFPLRALAFFSGLPLLLTGGTLALLVAASGALGPAGVAALIAALAVNTVAALYAYVRLCRRFLDGVEHVPNRPIDSRPLRVLWYGSVLSLNALSAGVFVALLAGTWPFSAAVGPVGVATAAFTAVGVPLPGVTSLLALAVLVLPLAGLLGLWGIHLVRRARTYRTLRARTRPAEPGEVRVTGAAMGAGAAVGTGATSRAAPVGGETGAGEAVEGETSAGEAVKTGDQGVPVRVLATPRAVAFATQSLPGRDAVVVSTGLLDELADEEVAAVIAHEEYHVRNGDPRWNLLASLFGLAVGGRNALVVAHDYPRVEREADRYAAREHGTETFVRALRRIERLRATVPPADAHTEAVGSGVLPRILAAPYRVLFGSVVLENAHASTDERIEAVLAAEET